MDKFIEHLDLTAKGVWFPIVVGIISLLFMLFMPKRLSWREIYLTFGVVGFVTLVIDVIIMSTWLDIFDLGSKPNIIRNWRFSRSCTHPFLYRCNIS